MLGNTMPIHGVPINTRPIHLAGWAECEKEMPGQADANETLVEIYVQIGRKI